MKFRYKQHYPISGYLARCFEELSVFHATLRNLGIRATQDIPLRNTLLSIRRAGSLSFLVYADYN